MLRTFFYNLGFLLFGLFYLPVFLAKIKQAENRSALIRERLGFFPPEGEKDSFPRKRIWLHAVSVGEVLAVEAWIKKFLIDSPECDLILTTVTPTGQKIAKQLENERLRVFYFPFDLTAAVRRFFRRFRPQCLLLVETEIWPNLLTEAKKAHVPVGILNGRLSGRSLKRYQKFLFLFKPLFEQLEFVLAQAPEDAERFKALGVHQERVHMLGNMKFDNAALNESLPPAAVQRLRQEWGFEKQDWIWVAGSTHAGEEKMIARIFQEMLKRYPSLKLLVAPRHIERCPVVKRGFEEKGLEVRLATEPQSSVSKPVLLLNRLGVLKDLYALADLVFMGGSLVPRGGQNAIEPACHRKPVLHGPFIFNFESLYRLLDREGGALLVCDEDQLRFALKRLLENPAEGHSLGANAYEAVCRLRGATDRHVQWVLKFLDSKNQAERINHVEVNEKLFSPSG